MDEKTVPSENLRKQAWDYFQMHGSQRLTTFNFYIVISSVITTAMFATFQKEYQAPYLGIILGLLLILMALIFWKIDVRNSSLIKGAEEALKFFEDDPNIKDSEDKPHVAKIFRREEFETRNKRSKNSLKFWNNYYSYTDCLRLVFICFSIVGFFGFIVAFLRIMGVGRR